LTSSFASLAALYDGEHRCLSADVDLYHALLADARVRGPVLELACGSGRIATPLALAGFRVTGLDLSAAMLRRARARRRTLPPEAAVRLRFSQQDMRSFRFRHRFDAAIIAFSSLALLADPDDRLACLQRLADHLGPRAPVVIDLPNPRPQPPLPTPRVVTSRFHLPRWGQLVEKVVEETSDPERRTTRVCYRYHLLGADGRSAVELAAASFELARIERREIESMLFATGFDVAAVLGDYRGSRHQPDSPRLVLHAERLG
jgi:ubiquinone/menaquinone biosynthesis C-methylase UbiE